MYEMASVYILQYFEAVFGAVHVHVLLVMIIMQLGGVIPM